MLTTGTANLAIVQWVLWLPQPTGEGKAASFGYSVGQPLACDTAYPRAVSQWRRGGEACTIGYTLIVILA